MQELCFRRRFRRVLYTAGPPKCRRWTCRILQLVHCDFQRRTFSSHWAEWPRIPESKTVSKRAWCLVAKGRLELLGGLQRVGGSKRQYSRSGTELFEQMLTPRGACTSMDRQGPERRTPCASPSGPICNCRMFRSMRARCVSHAHRMCTTYAPHVHHMCTTCATARCGPITSVQSMQLGAKTGLQGCGMSII